QVVVSRADGMLVQRLFEMEVPEIYDGTVVIRALARESGERTKVAVFSKDPDVDCVGACVGMKGMRVQSIIRELKGEKIDIIEYNEDALVFAANALSPAKINHVSVVDVEDKRLEVIVDDSQLSLAIGKKGQNVRLAAKLLGWKIDIKSEEEKRQEVEQQMSALVNQTATPLERVPDLGEGVIEKLTAAGVTTVEALADMTPEQLEAIPGIGPKTVEKISLAVNNYFSSLETGEAQAAETAPEEQPAADAEHAAELGPDSAGQSGDLQGLSDTAEMAPESVGELAASDQALEAEVVDGVESAPPADVDEVHTHPERPDEEEIPPGEKGSS
ncbi:MAG TPA: transcription termination/antitermination protein NusA, partial [Terriglobales bacterium]|nr:transcription termination/antitermination protein NusA [Terriglobales bacterium]